METKNIVAIVLGVVFLCFIVAALIAINRPEKEESDGDKDAKK